MRERLPPEPDGSVPATLPERLSVPGDGRVVRLDVSLRGLLMALGLVAAVLVLLRLWPVVVIIAVSFVFMAVLLPFVWWLMDHGLRRSAAVLLAVLLPVVALLGLLAATIPALVIEFGNIDENLPVYAADLERFLDNWGVHVDLAARARAFDLSDYASGSVTQIGEPVLFGLFSALTAIVITAYLLSDAPRLSQFVYQFVPPGREPEVEDILEALRHAVGGYVRGQAITSGAIALFTFVVLFAVGAPNPLAFAALAGFADLVPLVGAFIAVVPAVIATLGVSIERALVVLVLLVLYQQFEDRVLVPRVYATTLNLPPLVVLVVVLVGAQLFGIIGVLLSLPAAAAIRVLIDHALVHRRELFPHMTTEAGAEDAAAPADEPYAPDNPQRDEAQREAVPQ